jgi:integrase
MSGTDRLPPAVTRLPNSRWRMRTSVMTGSTKSISRTYATCEEAMVAYYTALRARAAGEDVAAALDALDAGAQPRPRATAPVRTVEELFGEFYTERDAVVAASDPTFRRSRRKGNYSLRFTTTAANRSDYKKGIRPYLGDKRLTELTREVIQGWMTELAGYGYNVETSGRFLSHLKFVIGHARRSELPDDFPWKSIGPVPPAVPRLAAPDPARWGGMPGSKPPAFTFKEGKTLSLSLDAADRIAGYCEHYGGPRIGEVFGLRLGEFSWRDDLLWVRIERQMLEDNQIVPWVKTDAAYRKIPLPPILAEYICAYVDRYHGLDLSNLRDFSDEHRNRLLVRNPAGRDLNGGYLPGKRSNYAGRLTNRRDANGFGYAELGYRITSHSLRKAVATYLLHAREIVRTIATDSLGPEPPPGHPDELGWLRQRRRLEDVDLAFSPMLVSQYLGHAHDRAHDESPASPVTLSHYNLSINSKESLKAVARTIDLIARHEVGTLLDEPDAYDQLPVYFPGDPAWVICAEAQRLTGLSQSNVTEGVRHGRFEGRLAWVADGGYERNAKTGKCNPAKPTVVVSRKSIDAYLELIEQPQLKDAQERLGITFKGVAANFLDTGRLPYEKWGNRTYIPKPALDALIDEIHDAVVETLAEVGPCTPGQLKEAFDERRAGRIFVHGRALLGWITHWLTDLIHRGRVRLAAGRYQAVPKGR